MAKVKILVVEDEPLVAADIANQLTDVGFEVVGIAQNGNIALEMLATKNPDAALLDISLGSDPDGIQLAHVINARYGIPFVFLTSHADRNTIEKVKETRPAGYLVKPFDEADLLTSLEIAVFNHMNRRRDNETPLSLELLNRSLPNALSEREYEILLLMRDGSTNKEIADRVFLSINTVKSHLLNIYEKLDAHNRTEVLFKLNKLLN